MFFQTLFGCKYATILHIRVSNVLLHVLECLLRSLLDQWLLLHSMHENVFSVSFIHFPVMWFSYFSHFVHKKRNFMAKVACPSELQVPLLMYLSISVNAMCDAFYIIHSSINAKELCEWIIKWLFHGLHSCAQRSSYFGQFHHQHCFLARDCCPTDSTDIHGPTNYQMTVCEPCVLLVVSWSYDTRHLGQRYGHH